MIKISKTAFILSLYSIFYFSPTLYAAGSDVREASDAATKAGRPSQDALNAAFRDACLNAEYYGGYELITIGTPQRHLTSRGGREGEGYTRIHGPATQCEGEGYTGIHGPAKKPERVVTLAREGKDAEHKSPLEGPCEIGPESINLEECRKMLGHGYGYILGDIFRMPLGGTGASRSGTRGAPPKDPVKSDDHLSKEDGTGVEAKPKVPEEAGAASGGSATASPPLGTSTSDGAEAGAGRGFR